MIRKRTTIRRAPPLDGPTATRPRPLRSVPAAPPPKPTAPSSFDSSPALDFRLPSEFGLDCYRSASPSILDCAPPLRLSSSHWDSSSSSYCVREMSTDTQSSSSVGSLLSSVSTDTGDTLTIRNGTVPSRGPSPLQTSCRRLGDSAAHPFVCLGPRCQEAFASDEELRRHVKSAHTHSCNWAGCVRPSFSTRDGLVYHVKVEHLIVCPVPGCAETSLFESGRLLQSHIMLAHPKDGGDDAREWQLPARVGPAENAIMVKPVEVAQLGKRRERDDDLDDIVATKQMCQDKLRSVVEKRAKKNAGKSPPPHPSLSIPS